MNRLIEKLRSDIHERTGLSGDQLETTLQHSIESLERLTFARILSEQLSTEEVDLYKELLDMDGEVDGYGFLRGIRPNEADAIITKIFAQEIQSFVTRI